MNSKTNDKNLGVNEANSTTSIFDTWTTPNLVRVNEVGESIEMIYKETFKMNFYSSSSFPQPQERVFKIIYSCVDGKWNKSERIYGIIIPESNESYNF